MNLKSTQAGGRSIVGQHSKQPQGKNKLGRAVSGSASAHPIGAHLPMPEWPTEP